MSQISSDVPATATEDDSAAQPKIGKLERKFLGMGRTGVVMLEIKEGKVVKAPRYPNDQEIAEDLSREIQCYKMLDAAPHPCVLRSLGADYDPQRPALFLPYMENGDLWSYLRQNGKETTSGQRLKWSCQVTMAVCHLHAMHVFHGDLRPHNILVDVNMGLAVSDFDAASFGIHGGRVFVTPQYSIKPFCRLTSLTAEELARVDILCLGSVLYVIQTGVEPFDIFKDDDEWLKAYGEGIFPDTSGVTLGDLILGIWREEITDPKDILFRIVSHVDFVDLLRCA